MFPGVSSPARRRAALGILALIGGCATLEDDPGRTAAAVAPVWPPSPDQPRFRYDFTIRLVGDIAKESSQSAMRRAVTGAPDPRTVKLFEKPGAIAARNGRLYVTDTGRQSVIAIDIPSRRVFQFGIREDEGRLHQPVAITRDDTGHVCVLDASKRKVRVYDDMGLYRRSIDAVMQMKRPAGVAAAPKGDRIYVVDRSTPEDAKPFVACYDAAGMELFRFGSSGTGPGELHLPSHAVVGRDGQVYVLDAGNFRVQVFDRDGRFVRSVGRLGAVPGSFARPRGLAVSDEGWIYVADAAFNNVQLFDADGRLLLIIGEQSSRPVDEPGRWGLIAGLASDETGRLYAIDQYFGKIGVVRRVTA